MDDDPDLVVEDFPEFFDLFLRSLDVFLVVGLPLFLSFFLSFPFFPFDFLSDFQEAALLYLHV